ncbi:MAG: N-acetylneuraminate synthase family protein, partial [Anaerovoracaceae bacterium]
MFYKELKISRIKIPSGEITNLPLLREISKHYRPIILSTGMCTI